MSLNAHRMRVPELMPGAMHLTGGGGMVQQSHNGDYFK